MKTMRMFATAAAATGLLGLMSASAASGDLSNGPGEKTYSGTVTAVDVPDHILSVRGFLFARSFNTGNDCKVSLEDKGQVSLGDLRPGQEVEVRYNDDNGVHIARNIAQHNLKYAGHITSIEPQHGIILVRGGAMTREFNIPPNVTVLLKDDQAKGLNRLQVGDEVTVVYEREHGVDSPVVYRIEQRSATYIGAITAIDPTTRTLKAKDGNGKEKQFSLADNCAIVINGRWNDSIDHLMAGEEVAINYNNSDGVLVANRVSPLAGPAPVAPAPTAKNQEPNAGQLTTATH